MVISDYIYTFCLACALTTIPIQLAPDVNQPVITVTTNWFGAAPALFARFGVVTGVRAPLLAT